MTWSDLLIGAGIVAGFVALRHFILPRFGVPT